ncbi:MAG TPA: hypothetical protein PLV68_19370, partial [Ilumatobacteraceae bacterium]|nr:hypothetical protein [Ilumatobacteraceae bacterium]
MTSTSNSISRRIAALSCAALAVGTLAACGSDKKASTGPGSDFCKTAQKLEDLNDDLDFQTATPKQIEAAIKETISLTKQAINHVEELQGKRTA